MTSNLSDDEDSIVAHLVENELQSAAAEPESFDDEYVEALEDLLEKTRS